MEYTIERAVNHAVREHALLVSVISSFANWGVLAFGVAACALWALDMPRHAGTWRRACAAGLSAAALGLLVSQLISHVWERPRPYADHPRGIIPLLTPSLDPSFPSDHATAAFGIAFGVLFVAGRRAWPFVVWAALIGLSRVLAGMHYPSDVLAGALIGLASGYLMVRVAMPVLVPLIALVSRLTDPLLDPAARSRLARATVRSTTFRRRAVALLGSVMLIVFAFRLRAHLLDEMPIATLAAWALVVALGLHIAGGREAPGTHRAD
jgi:undecaprenyl-diphosphatase